MLRLSKVTLAEAERLVYDAAIVRMMKQETGVAAKLQSYKQSAEHDQKLRQVIALFAGYQLRESTIAFGKAYQMLKRIDQ